MQATPILEPDHRPPAPGRAGRPDRRTTLTALVLIGVGTALYLGWDYLAATGIASLIIGFLPCVVMCSLGLCASRLMGRGGASGCHAGAADVPSAPPATSAEPPPTLVEPSLPVSS